MDFTAVFRDAAKCRAVAELIAELARRLGRGAKIMNFCGTHEWTVTRFGLRSIVPSSIDLVAGPGCPVCVTPAKVIEHGIRLSLEGFTVYTYGDLYRVPIPHPVKGARSLLEARSLGGDVRVVYSFLDAVKDAHESGRESVFLGIGFETTAPSYAMLFDAGKVPRNLLFLSALRLTPPIMRFCIETHARVSTPIDGVIAPGHVSTVIGAEPWSFLPRDYGIPTVVAGFEPLDVLMAVAMILRMLVEGRPSLEIEYRRSVSWRGNEYLKKLVSRVFTVVDAVWRGIGEVPESGLDLSERFREWNAFEELGLERPRGGEYENPPGCRCSEIVLGLAKPTDCPLFMKACTPHNPRGPCMVSSEGTCSIWARFGGGAVVRLEELGL